LKDVKREEKKINWDTFSEDLVYLMNMEDTLLFHMGDRCISVKYRIESRDPTESSDGAFQIDHQTELVMINGSSDKLVIDQPCLDGYHTVGGLEEQIGAIRDLIEVPIKHPDLFSSQGKRWKMCIMAVKEYTW
jgi:hypothetical protein